MSNGKKMSADAIRTSFRKSVNFKFTFQQWRHAAKAFVEKWIGSPEISLSASSQSGHSGPTAAQNYGREESSYLGSSLDFGIEAHYNMSLAWHQLLRLSSHSAEDYCQSSSQPGNAAVGKKRKLETEGSQPDISTVMKLIITPQTLELPRGNNFE